MEGGRAEKAGGLHNAAGALLTGRNRVLAQRKQQVCERGGKGNRGKLCLRQIVQDLVLPPDTSLVVFSGKCRVRVANSGRCTPEPCCEFLIFFPAMAHPGRRAAATMSLQALIAMAAVA